MYRRSFLVGSGALVLSQLIAGCSARQKMALKVRLLKDSIPGQLLREFRRELSQPAQLDFDPEEQLKALFNRLQSWQRQVSEKAENQSPSPLPFTGRQAPVVADLVTLGDYWLTQAIRENLIQPLNLEEASGWQNLPPRWQELVRRDTRGRLSDTGEIWGAPYRWGSTVIAYHREKMEELGWIPTDWSDLWHPELRDRISLFNQPREVIGLTLKKLGKSYNTEDLTQVPDLKSELLALHQHVKLYSSDTYLEPLILGDTWVAVGWSTDILPLRQRNPYIEAIVPRSGTALWSDVWVQPSAVASRANSTETEERIALAQKWIEFCWQTEPATKISLYSDAASPALLPLKSTDLPEAIRDNPILFPTPAVLDKSEFLQPLPESTVEQYQDLWREVRRS